VTEAGASDDEIKQAISDAILVRDSAKDIIASFGLKKLGITEDIDSLGRTVENSRIKELVSIAAAFAVNCASNLDKHIAAARTVGITDDEIESVLDATAFVKGKAANYAGKIGQLEEEYDQLQRLLKQLQETQAQLVQSEKMAALSKLVAGVVHEMNTPIGTINSATNLSTRAITNILEVLETSQTLDEVKNSKRLQASLMALQNNIPVTVAASERITRIVSSLKSFARLDESTFQKTDIHEGLESTLPLIEHECKEQISVVKEYGDIPQVVCYPGELNQVFMNLLTNAVQAIEGKGTITIRTFAENENVHIQIADTGVGIPPERMPRLFEPSFSQKNTRVKAGMGLFISYNIMQKHRGEIKVESEVGKGSTFTLILPIDLEEQAEVEENNNNTR